MASCCTPRAEALFVDEDEGCGLELSPVEEGMLVLQIFDFPGQGGLEVGDTIVAVDGVPLAERACGSEDEQESTFGKYLRHGAVIDVLDRIQDPAGAVEYRCPYCWRGFEKWEPCLKHLERNVDQLDAGKCGQSLRPSAQCVQTWREQAIAAASGKLKRLRQPQRSSGLIVAPKAPPMPSFAAFPKIDEVPSAGNSVELVRSSRDCAREQDHKKEDDDVSCASSDSEVLLMDKPLLHCASMEVASKDNTLDKLRADSGQKLESRGISKVSSSKTEMAHSSQATVSVETASTSRERREAMDAAIGGPPKRWPSGTRDIASFGTDTTAEEQNDARFRCPTCWKAFHAWPACLRHLRDEDHGPPPPDGPRRPEDEAACVRRWMTLCFAAARGELPRDDLEKARKIRSNQDRHLEPPIQEVAAAAQDSAFNAKAQDSITETRFVAPKLLPSHANTICEDSAPTPSQHVVGKGMPASLETSNQAGVRPETLIASSHGDIRFRCPSCGEGFRECRKLGGGR